MAALSAANTGHGSWENGWVVERVDGDEVVVRGGRLRVRAPAADCRGAGDAVSPARPERAARACPPASGSRSATLRRRRLDVRVYWNVAAGGAPRLVAAVTGVLNAAGVPFRLKVADHPYRFARRDAAVLYLAGDVFRERRHELVVLARGLALRPGVPAWTLELAPGLGAAEDRDGESFGMWPGARARRRGRGARVTAVAARFAEDGVELDAPYRAGRACPLSSPMPRRRWGGRSCRDAIWDDGRCTWVGGFEDPAMPWRAEYRALEADLYDGTAGIGLFLAHLSAVTGSDDARRAAVGALRHATGRAVRREGLHVGSLGVAWAAAHARRAAGRGGARRGGARELAPRRRSTEARSTWSSAAPARRSPGSRWPSCSTTRALSTTRSRRASGCSPPRPSRRTAGPGRRRTRRAAGTSAALSHGAAGIGWALLELYAATGDERFRSGAEGAFAYERWWLDRGPARGPICGSAGSAASGACASPAIGSWCHGEAGIALTRLRAAERSRARTRTRPRPQLALATTARVLAARLPFDLEDVTLCHGAAGAADVLLCAGATELPERLGRGSRSRDHDPAGRDWPSGIAAGSTPALFQGLSGIGWWFLRLHDPAIPSPFRLTRVRAAA